jgi:hypothetical protein
VGRKEEDRLQTEVWVRELTESEDRPAQQARYLHLRAARLTSDVHSRQLGNGDATRLDDFWEASPQARQSDPDRQLDYWPAWGVA